MIFKSFCLFFIIQVTSGLLFSCVGRSAGYYADVLSDCQQYHFCTGGRLQFTYSCPNTTRFQQRMMICDHEHLVDCSKSEQDFSANLLIGKQGVPFVSPQEFHPKRKRLAWDLDPTPSHVSFVTEPFETKAKPYFTNIRTFVTTVSPIQDYPLFSRHLKSVEDNSLRRSSRVRLEWTLPDTRAMLFIPDNPADAVLPNIKKYSVNIPKMIFRAEKIADPLLLSDASAL